MARACSRGDRPPSLPLRNHQLRTMRAHPQKPKHAHCAWKSFRPGRIRPRVDGRTSRVFGRGHAADWYGTETTFSHRDTEIAEQHEGLGLLLLDITFDYS